MAKIEKSEESGPQLFFDFNENMSPQHRGVVVLN